MFNGVSVVPGSHTGLRSFAKVLDPCFRRRAVGVVGASVLPPRVPFRELAELGVGVIGVEAAAKLLKKDPASVVKVSGNPVSVKQVNDFWASVDSDQRHVWGRLPSGAAGVRLEWLAKTKSEGAPAVTALSTGVEFENMLLYPGRKSGVSLAATLVGKEFGFPSEGFEFENWKKRWDAVKALSKSGDSEVGVAADGLMAEQLEAILLAVDESTTDSSVVRGFSGVRVLLMSAWGVWFEGELDLLFVRGGKIHVGEIKTYLAGPYGDGKKFLSAAHQMAAYQLALSESLNRFVAERDGGVFVSDGGVDDSRFAPEEFFSVTHGSVFQNDVSVVDCLESVGKLFTAAAAESVVGDSVSLVSLGDRLPSDVLSLPAVMGLPCQGCPLFELCDEEGEVTDFIKMSSSSHSVKLGLKANGSKSVLNRTSYSYLPVGRRVFVSVIVMPGGADRVLGVSLVDEDGVVLGWRLNATPSDSRSVDRFLRRVGDDFAGVGDDVVYVFSSRVALQALRVNVLRSLRSSFKEASEMRGKDAGGLDKVLKLAFFGDHLLSSRVVCLKESFQQHFAHPYVGPESNLVYLLETLDDAKLDDLSSSELLLGHPGVEVYPGKKYDKWFDSEALATCYLNGIGSSDQKERLARLKAKRAAADVKVDVVTGEFAEALDIIDGYLSELSNFLVAAWDGISVRLEGLLPADLSGLKKYEDRLFLRKETEDGKMFENPMLWAGIWDEINWFSQREFIEGLIVADIVSQDPEFAKSLDPSIVFKTTKDGYAPVVAKLREGDKLFPADPEVSGSVSVRSLAMRGFGLVEVNPASDGGSLLGGLEPDFWYKTVTVFNPPFGVKKKLKSSPVSVDGGVTLGMVDASRLFPVDRGVVLSDSDAMLERCVERYSAGGNMILKSPPGAGKTYAVTSFCAASHLVDEKVVIITQTRNQSELIADSLRDEFGLDPLVWLGGDGVKSEVALMSDIIVTTAAKFTFNQAAFADGGERALLVDEAWQMKFFIWTYLAGADCWSKVVLVGDPGQIPPVNTVDTRFWGNQSFAPHVAAPEVIMADIVRQEAQKKKYDAEVADKGETKIILHEPFGSWFVDSFPSTRRFGPVTTKLVETFYDFKFGSLYDEPNGFVLDGKSLGELNLKKVTDWDDAVAGVAGLVGSLFSENGGLSVGDGVSGSADVGVICSQTQQVSVVQAALKGFPGVLVETPERWQGLEAKVIVAFDPMFLPSEFSASRNRMCVVVSRHKDALVLVSPVEASSDLKYFFNEVLPGITYVSGNVLASDFYDVFDEVEEG